MRSASRRTAHDNPHESGRIERGSALEGLRSRLVRRRRREHGHAAHALLCLRGERHAAAARYTYMSAGRGDRRSTFWVPPMPTLTDGTASTAGNPIYYA